MKSKRIFSRYITIPILFVIISVFTVMSTPVNVNADWDYIGNFTLQTVDEEDCKGMWWCYDPPTCSPMYCQSGCSYDDYYGYMMNTIGEYCQG